MLIKDIDTTKLTPMMQQYIKAKKEQPDCLLFFRMGDFYELFFDDALAAAKALELTLTSRNCGLPERAPMCGVPHHAADNYINRLIKQGFRVAICEQIEDPALAKGLVKRSIVRVITPGTVTDEKILDQTKYAYLTSVFKLGDCYGLAYCDISSGLFLATEFSGVRNSTKLLDELARIRPAELISNQDFRDLYLEQKLSYPHTVVPDEYFSLNENNDFVQLKQAITEAKTNKQELWVKAAASLLAYVVDTQKLNPLHFAEVKYYRFNNFMILDDTARRNLELTETIRDQKRKGSLLWSIDKTKSNMGQRMLRNWLEQPLIDRDDILYRQQAVGELIDRFIVRQELRELLSGIYDLERLASKLVYNSLNARDLKSLQFTLSRIPDIHRCLNQPQSDYLQHLYQELFSLPELQRELAAALKDELPISTREGGMINDGYDQLVDEYREADNNGKQWLLDLENSEKEKTGIKNLRVKYNRVFGYFIEVSKGKIAEVPDYYIRRQTLANNERFTTPELKEVEDRLLGASQKLLEREYEIFCQLRNLALQNLRKLQANAHALAQLDVLCSLAEVAERNNYCRPEIIDEPIINYSAGRHPVVELMLEDSSFVANDLLLDQNKSLMILTGPNMAGKSTFMRQTALIALLTQIGSYVPCNSCHIGIFDRIFTRVGASDDVSAGKSTFMVEMTEMAEILREATANSLLILDEIGRGTSTFDGLAIARSVVEKLADKQSFGSLTLFATHYHELTELAEQNPHIFNSHIEVAEQNGDIVFLHHIRDGGSDDSYGIDVAKLAGLPLDIIARAKSILRNLENNQTISAFSDSELTEWQTSKISSDAENYRELINEIKHLDLNRLTPLEALTLIAEWQKKVNRDD